MAIGVCTDCELRWRLSGRQGRRFATGTVRCSLCGGVLHRLRSSVSPSDAPVPLIFHHGTSLETIRFEAEGIVRRGQRFHVAVWRAKRTLELLERYEQRQAHARAGWPSCLGPSASSDP